MALSFKCWCKGEAQDAMRYYKKQEENERCRAKAIKSERRMVKRDPDEWYARRAKEFLTKKITYRY